MSENIRQGMIVKALSGFYYVDDGNEVLECRARGVFKKRGLSPLVGDLVDVDASGDTPVVTKVHDRTNRFDRPPVANVEQFIVVSALKEPDPNFAVIDKFLVNAEFNDVPAILCFNKRDLASEDEIEAVKAIYGDTYPIVFTEARNAKGMEELLPYLKDRRSALIGPSGAGKSSTINALRNEYSAEIGDISEKNRRGKNTTRHVELFRLKEGGSVYDTPGFTSFDLPEVQEDDLQFMYPEIRRFVGMCRFNGCRHMREPDCAVREAAENGEINERRYSSYRDRIEEIREREKNRY